MLMMIGNDKKLIFFAPQKQGAIFRLKKQNKGPNHNSEGKVKNLARFQSLSFEMEPSIYVKNDTRH